MEVELEPRVKPLSYKVKAVSRESPAQKATHLLDTDLRNHWSTGTNTKEWLLLELDEPCLLSHIRIHNKSVLEWEIAAGLQYKPETFIKIRPRCEAPRRDMVYSTNYSPCRYVRISFLRGNPIAVFFVQLIGVSVTGLEAEFLPVVNYLLPQIISHKQDAYDIHLQLLQSMVKRLVHFLPQLEADLSIFSEAAEVTLRFLAMLAGPLYPILHVVNEREIIKVAGNLPDSDASKSGQLSVAFSVSSNFEPRRLRNASVTLLPTSSYSVFRPDTVFMLLRHAYKDSNLGKVCKMVSSVLLKLSGTAENDASFESDVTSDETSKSEPCVSPQYADYSIIFGEEFLISDGNWDTNYLSILDVKLAEEGLLHLMFACASQPILCNKLADNASDLWLALPLVQALVPALRPIISSPEKTDDGFSPWKQPFVRHALTKIVEMSSSLVYRPLLRACAGYLSSFSPSHAKAACVVIDLCSSVLAPWITQLIAKADLTVELVEDLFGDIQGARFSFRQARAALKYVVLAISGNMDDIMPKYKDVKHQILFLLEMLDPFLDPAMIPVNSLISFGNVPAIFVEKQLQNCAIALNVIRRAVNKAAILPSLEAEWRRGTVPPSVLLSILDPRMQLPADIDLHQCPAAESLDMRSLVALSHSSLQNGGASLKPASPDDADGNVDNVATAGRIDFPEDASFLFAPSELRLMSLTEGNKDGKSSGFADASANIDGDGIFHNISRNDRCDSVGQKDIYTGEHPHLVADYVQLTNFCECEKRASEFRRFAQDLHSQHPLTPEGHDAAVDALLLAAECFVNPYFMMSSRDTARAISKKVIIDESCKNCALTDVGRALENNDYDVKLLADLESKRDKAVLEILLEAAEMDRKYHKAASDSQLAISYGEDNEATVTSKWDTQSADAITLVRHNQERLCSFLIQRLQKDHQSMHEILLQMVLLLLNSATKLNCDPELVVDVILRSTEILHSTSKSIYYQFKEGKLQLNHWRVHEVQRRWMLLQRLVIASSGSDEESNLSVNIRNIFRFANLVPPAAWLSKIPTFHSSASPLVRYIGWMAVSRNAKQYLKERLFLASDLSQLTRLLSIFSDELAGVEHIAELKDENKKPKDLQVDKDNIVQEMRQPPEEYFGVSLTAICPEISQFFPKLKKQFKDFGETILEAVGLQLKSLPSAIVPDLLNWFSDLSLWPFLLKRKDQMSSQDNPVQFKGFAARNAKVVILFVLEAILSVHSQAMVPEVPRVVHVLESLCRSCYCDMSFLDSVLSLLKPIISYSLHKVSTEETVLTDDSCVNFESLCFSELLSYIRQNSTGQRHVQEYGPQRALVIFVLASVLPDLSYRLKIEVLKSSLCWADFASRGKSTYFDYYLRAYQMLMNSCKILLLGAMRTYGVVPLQKSMCSDAGVGEPYDGTSESILFLFDVCQASLSGHSIELAKETENPLQTNEEVYSLTSEEVEEFSEELERIINRLSTSTDVCFKFHPKLAKILAITSAECFIYAKCMLSIVQKVQDTSGIGRETLRLPNLTDLVPYYWNTSLEEFAEMILVLLGKHCWDVAAVMLDSLVGLPRGIPIESAIGKICSAMKIFFCSAPNISWRLQSDKWMSSLVERGIHLLLKSESPIADVFSSMLMHSEPEQRFIGIKHLKLLLGQDMHSEAVSSHLGPSDSDVASLSILSTLISHIWNQIVHLVSSDTSPVLRVHAMGLLMNCIPFADCQSLRSLLLAADTVLPALINLTPQTCEGPIAKFSLSLLANICLHSQYEDIYLVPDVVWSKLESFGALENEKSPLGLERRICQALIKLRNKENKAKQVLKELLSSRPTEQAADDFGSTQQAILQVISNSASAPPYFDFFSKEIDRKALEFEEAEIEMELLQKEYVSQEAFKDMHEWNQHPFLADHVKDDRRLQLIKDEIRSLEKSKVREEIIARKQKKLLFRLARQKYLEDAAVRESELLKELDRERTSEAERELERQRLLEIERAKTRELQHNLDIEREKQTQRDLQRELEQIESGGGVRDSRREYSSSHSGRPRYRERENGRAGSDSGSLRASPSGAQSDATSSNAPLTTTPKVVLSGGRQFSGQLPTILQSQDRMDDYSSPYEENIDGSKDSGDTGSIGDPDNISSLEGQGFGSSTRHGSRGSRSRQILERRERDRREGKWERKH